MQTHCIRRKLSLPSLNDDFSVNHEFSPKIVVEQTSYNGLIKLTLDDYGLIQVYRRENRSLIFHLLKNFTWKGIGMKIGNRSTPNQHSKQ